MAVLRFKILVDELDDVVRLIELKSDQNFKDFKMVLDKSFELRALQPSSFFISNTKRQKVNEITLGQSSSFENAIDGLTSSVHEVISNNERFIYFNESVPQFTFYINFQNQFEESDEYTGIFPRCIKKIGNLPSMGTGFGDDIFDENISLHIDNVVEDPEDDFY